MAETILKYQCPTCGGPVHFDAKTQMILCDYCESKFPENYFDEKTEEKTEEDKPKEKIDWKKEGFVKERVVLENQIGFICSSCGAEVVSDGNTAATECMYCGNPIVLNENVSEMLTPDLIIPFKIDKKQAEKYLEEFYNNKFLLPKAFKDKNRIKKITGMYVPFWLYSAKENGNIIYDARKTSTWSDNDYIYTKTKFYDVVRVGNLEFDKIPVDASQKMKDNYMDGLEPYNYDDLVEFSPSYMAGYFADKFDVNVDECLERAKTRMENSTSETIRNSVTGYTSVIERSKTLTNSELDINYSLFPVWMLNTKYHDKIYQFAINGQTGKVSGDLPIDKRKRNLLFLGITLATYAASAFFAYLFLS